MRLVASGGCGRSFGVDWANTGCFTADAPGHFVIDEVCTLNDVSQPILQTRWRCSCGRTGSKVVGTSDASGWCAYEFETPAELARFERIAMG